MNKPLITMSKDALVSLLLNRNQTIEELQAQLAVSEDDLRVAEAGIAELQAQVVELEFKLTSYTIVKRMIKAEKQVEELQAQIDMLMGAIQHANEYLSSDATASIQSESILHKKFRAAIKGEGDEV